MLNRRALGEILLVTRTADAPRETTRARFQSGSKQLGRSVAANARTGSDRACPQRSRHQSSPQSTTPPLPWQVMEMRKPLDVLVVLLVVDSRKADRQPLAGLHDAPPRMEKLFL